MSTLSQCSVPANEPRGLLADPYGLNLILNGFGLLGSKYEDQATRYSQNINNGLLQQGQFGENAKDRAIRDRLADSRIKYNEAYTSNLAAPKVGPRQMFKAGDGFNYWRDNLQRVLPGLAQMQKPTTAMTNLEAAGLTPGPQPINSRC